MTLLAIVALINLPLVMALCIAAKEVNFGAGGQETGLLTDWPSAPGSQPRPTRPTLNRRGHRLEILLVVNGMVQ
jgi:hypothetical protein